jgi:F-type H+-transporting ATPase subunit delta
MPASFRGASADALADLIEELDRTVTDAAQAAPVADELFSVTAVVRGDGGLRRFLTDRTMPQEAKTGLIGEVFGDQLGDASRTLIESASQRWWTRVRDLADALEHLGVVAAVKSAGTESERLTHELFALGEAVKNNPDLRDALSDPARSFDAKAELVDRLLSGKALPATVTLAKQALTGSYRTVNVALRDYEETAAAVHQQGLATVRVARPLSDAEQQRLGDALARTYDRPVHLNVLVDPEVVGGIRVEIGDDVIDGSVSSRLADAQRLLAG